MLLAYIDEIGEPGAFVARSNPQYNTSPAFGYAGVVLPEETARQFGVSFTEEKRRVFQNELDGIDNVGGWERKGSSIFRARTLEDFPQYVRVFNSLVRRLRNLGGKLFYYADEKPIGTPRQTHLDIQAREAAAMRETLNRLARYAQSADMNLLVMLDQINEKQRTERIRKMYAHVFSRSAEFPEMARIVEPPMHIDSQLSAGIQFADWVAAFVGRAIEYQLLADAPCPWIATPKASGAVRGSFTRESKLHLYQRVTGDLHHSDVFNFERRLFPSVRGHLIGADIPSAMARKLRGQRTH